jgi:hypothetical protein
MGEGSGLPRTESAPHRRVASGAWALLWCGVRGFDLKILKFVCPENEAAASFSGQLDSAVLLKSLVDAHDRLRSVAKSINMAANLTLLIDSFGRLVWLLDGHRIFC